MHQFKLLGLVVSAFLCATTSGQVRQANTKGNYSIPFRLTAYNNILVRAVVNGHDTVSLMLHTASSDVTVTEEASAKLQTIKFNGTVDSVKSWGGNANSSDFSQHNAVALAGMRWDSLTIWRDKNSGQETDGKFGLNLFENKIVELDFD